MNVYAETNKLITYLEIDSSEAKNIKAQFRHATAVEPGENPFLFGWMIEHLSPDMNGEGWNISFSEYAVYVALSMYAIYPHNDKSHTIAQAAGLIEIKRQKLAEAETASDMKQMQTVLRGLVKLISSRGYAFDYGRLAEDLYFWQIDKTKIARKWEREYVMKGDYNEKTLS